MEFEQWWKENKDKMTEGTVDIEAILKEVAGITWNAALDRDRPNPANGFSSTSSDGAEINRGQPLDFMQS